MFGDDWGVGLTATAQPTTQTAGGPGHRALYLRWRPRRFQDVVGQEHVTRTLRNAVMRRRLAHAYLFTGPRGTGKTSVARILYRAANCERSVDGDPCNTCPLCLAALEGRAMELMEVDAASNRGIDDIRDLREKVAFRPSEGAYRLYIIDEAHELTTPAWDAFLKTLEEPPAHAIFVLATTEAHKVPATIVSRCQRFDFRRIPFEATREQLARVAAAEKLEVDPNVLERLARVARGGLRDALSLLDQLSAFAGGHVDMQVARAVLGLPPVEAVRAVIEALGRHDAADLMARISDMAEGGADLRQFVEELAANLRAILIARAGGESTLASEFSAEELAWLCQQAPAWTVGSLIALVQELTNALARTRDSQQFQVQVELSLLRVCQPVTNQVQESAVREIAPQRAAVRAETGIDSNAGKQQAPRPASASWPVALDSQPAQENSDGSAERVKGASGPVGDSPPALADRKSVV
jgi:DNA polymerase-3 subunit gamma/tau